MVEYSILTEQRLEIYKDISTKAWQRVITYQTEGFAPRTVWIDEDKLVDAVYEGKNPGKPIPANIQTQGDAVRRAAFDTDIARIKAAPQARKI